MNIFVKASLSLVILWALIAGVVWLAADAKVTPEKISTYIEEHPLNNLDDPNERMSVVRKIADQVNQLDFEQRREARQREDGGLFELQKQMKPAERAEFTKLTIGPTFDHLMKGLNEMDPEERKQLTKEVLETIRESKGGPPRGSIEAEDDGEELLDKVASEGLRAYYEEASADTKMDLAPVLEEIQRKMQQRRGNRSSDRRDRYKNL